MAGPRSKWVAVHQLITTLGLSELNACRIAGLPRSTFRLLYRE